MSKIPVELSGLTPSQKREVVKRMLRERVAHAAGGLRDAGARTVGLNRKTSEDPVEAFYRFEGNSEYRSMQTMKEVGKGIGINNPYYRPIEGMARASSSVAGKELVTYSYYNYLGMSGDSTVNEAAKAAIDRYGTSVSASRIVSGERPLHQELEAVLARSLEVEDCIVFISGFTTNVTVIGHLFGPKDLILHDELSHNSLMQGAILSGARRMPFAHNDWKAVDRILQELRSDYEQVLISIEGMYSMDGDFPDPRPLIEIKKRHHALLMIDEAHSFGVLGAHGFGLGEHYDIPRDDVDIWMGTLSKSLGSVGGYIGGRRELVDYLRYTAPGALYSVGLSPPNAAAALTALQLMAAEPERLERLHRNGRLFLALAKERGLNTGLSMGVNIVPVIVGSSPLAIVASNAMLEEGISVQPIVYPAVEDKAARLRFFLSCDHSEEQIRRTVDLTASTLQRLRKT
jgi:8-amino-7-oxononanoate synthase